MRNRVTRRGRGQYAVMAIHSLDSNRPGRAVSRFQPQADDPKASTRLCFSLRYAELFSTKAKAEQYIAKTLKRRKGYNYYAHLMSPGDLMRRPTVRKPVYAQAEFF